MDWKRPFKMYHFPLDIRVSLDIAAVKEGGCYLRELPRFECYLGGEFTRVVCLRTPGVGAAYIFYFGALNV